MISRRRLLWGGAGAIVLGGLGVFGLGRLGLQHHIASVVRRRLGYLHLDPAGVDEFAKDQTNALINKKIPTWNRLIYHFQSVTAASFKRYERSADARSPTTKQEDAFLQTYLLSSDFFRNGADESRVIKYVAFHDPLRACWNPFTRLPVDPATPS